MQETYKEVFELAKRELPGKVRTVYNETFIIFKGFKIGVKNKIYYWKDVRNDDYYEDVYPLITEKVLELGFVKTIHMIMVHDDQDKLDAIQRQIDRLDKEIEYWVNMATKAYNKYRKDSKSKTAREKKDILEKYNKKKRLYEKKRRILKEEKEKVILDYNFYENRIKLFNHN